MSARFWVDETDSFFPTIELWDEDSDEEPLTWTEAKRKIDEVIAKHLEHWHDQRNYWRHMRKPTDA